jgi:hypothetical protein
MKFRGTDAMQRGGVMYTLATGNDHPIARLMQTPMRARPGTLTTIGLKKSLVKITLL